MVRAAACRVAGVVAAAALLASACASGRSSNRFIRYGGGSGPIELMEGPVPPPPVISEAAVQAAVRTAKRERGAVPAALPTAETTDGTLRDALQALRDRPSAEAHVRVARAYVRLGVLDLAVDHFDEAVRLNPRSAAAYDGRARAWRDWHLPGYAIGDAYRAVHFAPRSGAAQNTLGTVLMLTGTCQGAQAAFERALALDPSATWAASNLDQVQAMRRARSRACRDIAAVEPMPQEQNR